MGASGSARRDRIEADREPPSRRASPRRLVWAVLIAVMVSVAAIFAGWKAHTTAARRHALPSLPALAGKPAELQSRLREAAAAAWAQTDAPRVAALARLYHANGYLLEAKACWSLLVRLQPTEPRWPYYLADIAQAEADDEALRTWVRKSLALAPTYSAGWLFLADFAFKRGDLDEAEQAYRHRLELTPGDPYARFGVARIALARGDRVEAKRKLVDLLNEHGDFSAAHNLYAELAADDGERGIASNQRWFGTVAGRFRAAADPWKEELRPFCFDPDQLLVWGEVDLQTKHGDRGKAYFDRATAVAPNSAAVWEKLGEFYVDAGDNEKARAAYERGWQLPGTSEILGSALNDVYLNLRQPAEALRVMDEGIRRLPDSSILHNARGTDLAALGRVNEAIAEFNVAIAKSANNPSPLANLGLALLQRGQRAEARQYLRRALALQPVFAKALNAEAHLALEEGDFQTASRLIFPYFEQYPGLRLARTLMADYYVAHAVDAAKRGDNAAAEKWCHEGLGIVADAATLHGYLGIQYLETNRVASAIDELETSHHLDARDPRCIQALATAYVRAGRASDAATFLRSAADDATARQDQAAASRYRQMASSIPSR